MSKTKKGRNKNGLWNKIKSLFDKSVHSFVKNLKEKKMMETIVNF